MITVCIFVNDFCLIWAVNVVIYSGICVISAEFYYFCAVKRDWRDVYGV
jgi:hypothetical protein